LDKILEFEKKNGLSSDGLDMMSRIRRMISIEHPEISEVSKKFDEISKGEKVTHPRSDGKWAENIDWDDLTKRANSSKIAWSFLERHRLYYSALDLAAQKKHSEAVEMFSKAHEHSEKIHYADLFAHLLLRESVSLVFKKNPTDFTAMYAWFHMEMPNLSLPVSIKFLKKCIQTHPTRIVFHDLLGAIYGFAKEWEYAEACITRVIESDPSDTTRVEYAYYNRAIAISRQSGKNREAEAIKDFQTFLVSAPVDHRKTPQAYYEIALLLVKDDPEKVIAYYEAGKRADTFRLSCYQAMEYDTKKILEASVPLLKSKLKVETKFIVLQCQHCHRLVLERLQCSRCKVAVYCSKDHQKEDWPQHKKKCTSN